MQDKTEHVLDKMKAIQHENIQILLIIGVALSILGGLWSALIGSTTGFLTTGILPIICIAMFGSTKKTGWGIAYLIVFLLSNFGIFIEILTVKGVLIYVGIAVFFVLMLAKNDKRQQKIDVLELKAHDVAYSTAINSNHASTADEIKQKKSIWSILLYSIAGIGGFLSIITLVATLLSEKKIEIIILCVLSVFCSIMLGITKRQVWGACYLIMFILPRHYVFTHNNSGIPVLIVMGFMTAYFMCMCLCYVHEKKAERLQKKSVEGGETL